MFESVSRPLLLLYDGRLGQKVVYIRRYLIFVLQKNDGGFFSPKCLRLVAF